MPGSNDGSDRLDHLDKMYIESLGGVRRLRDYDEDFSGYGSVAPEDAIDPEYYNKRGWEDAGVGHNGSMHVGQAEVAHKNYQMSWHKRLNSRLNAMDEPDPEPEEPTPEPEQKLGPVEYSSDIQNAKSLVNDYQSPFSPLGEQTQSNNNTSVFDKAPTNNTNAEEAQDFADKYKLNLISSGATKSQSRQFEYDDSYTN